MMDELRASIDAGEEDVKQGKTKHFTADEFATYLAERAMQIIQEASPPVFSADVQPASRSGILVPQGASLYHACLDLRISVSTCRCHQYDYTT